MRPSDLSNKISLRLMREIAAGSFAAGDHVGAQQVADRFGVSRTPVREALGVLERKGLLKRRANRGYFVADGISAQLNELLQAEQASDGDDYQRLADDWLTDRLPEVVTEQSLRQHYGWTKAKVNELLVRAAREGWAERRYGYGWRLLPVAKTPAAFDEIYRFRMAIEPVAMLEPTFELDRKVLIEQRRIQERMLEVGIDSLPSETVLENGALFHEELIKLSRNPFFLIALQRVNRMRRLIEYRADVSAGRLVEQCSGHLEIISLLENGNVIEASYKMRQHLSGAIRRKSPIAWNWAVDAGVKADNSTRPRGEEGHEDRDHESEKV